MADTDKSAVLKIGADGTQAKEEFASVGAAGQQMGDKVSQGAEKGGKTLGGLAEKAKQAADAVRKSSEQAGDGLDKMSKRGEKASESLTRAERSAVSSLERMQAALSTTSKSGYLEKIFELRGIDASKPKIAELLKSLKEAEAAQVALKVATDATAASSVNASATIGKTYGNLVEGTKAYNAALRQVPAQITDIVVGLQGGQAPMTVLLQQGGQLRDIFGSAGGAARALGATIATLVTPFTAVAATLGLLAYGYSQGSKEADEFRKALILTGGASGVTLGQLTAMSATLDNLGTTQGRAAEALTVFAQAGISGASSLERFTLAAIRLEDVGGQAVADTAKAFADLAKDPLGATIRLNESMNYLTTSTYEQIKALEEQGKTTEAARLAQDAYSTAIERNADGIVQNLGTIERAWAGIVKMSKEAIDAVKSVGRDKSPEQVLLEQLQARSNAAELARRASERGQNAPSTANAEADQELARLSKRVMLQMDSAQLDAQRNKMVKEAIEWDKEGLKYLGDKAKMEREVAKVREQGFAAGKSQIEIEERIAAVREKYKEKQKSPASVSDADGRIAAAIAKELELIELQIDGTDKLTKSERFRVETASDIAEALRKKEITEKQAIERTAQLNTVVARAVELEGALAEAKFQSAQAKAVEVASSGSQRALDSLERQIDKEREHFEALGKTKQEVAALEIAKLEQAATSKDLLAVTADEIDLSGELGDSYRREASALRELAALKSASAGKARQLEIEKDVAKANENAAKKAYEEWKRTSDKIADTITDGLMRGFESGKSLAENLRDTIVNMFKTMVLRPVVSAFVNPIAQALVGSAGLSGAGGAYGATGSGADGIGAMAQLKSTYDTISGAFTSLGNSVAFVADDIGMWLVNNTTGALNKFGSSLMQNAGSIGTAASYAGGALAGYGLGKSISGKYSVSGDGNGDTAVIGGTAIGAIFGGPVGAAIGGAIGGLINRAFGQGAKEYTGGGIEGTLAGRSMSGRAYSEWKRDGGWFSSGSSGTDYSSLGAGQSEALGSAFASVTGEVAGFAQALGLSAGTVLGFTKQIRLALGSDAEANKAAIAALFKGIADEAAATVLDAKYIRQGETAAVTLQRLAVNLTAVNATFDLLGKSLLTVSAASGDLSSQLADAFGGLEKYQSAIGAYYQRYYSQEERFAKTRDQLQQSLGALGLAMPATIAAYRELVSAQDVTTASGMQTYAALISLSSAFADVTESASSMGDTIAKAFKDISDSLATLITNIQGQRDQNATAAASLSPAAVSESAIRAGIDTALSGIVAPTTSAVVAAIQRKINADNAAVAASAVVNTTQYATNKITAATSYRDGALAQYNATAATAAATPTTVRLHGVRGTWWGGSEGYDYDAVNPSYAPAQAAATAALQNYNAALAEYSQAVATYGATAAKGTAATNAYNAALAERLAAENQIKAAQNAYTNELRAYVLSASTGLEKLAALREKTLEYYQQQKAIADMLANSAANLRQSMKDALFSALTPERQQQQLQSEFYTAYAMAQVSSGEALARYADQLGALLPRITAGLGDTATSSADYAAKSGAFTAQISAIADRLDEQASVNYLQTSVDLLTLIDAKMAALEATSTSAQALIVAAIDAGSLRTADGLQQIINALTGKSVSAFASGGYYPGGLALVGEQGPELINFANPGQVYTAAQTQGMFAGDSRATAEELRAMRADLRAAQVQTAALMQRLVKINEKWDGDGLPSTRVETV